MPSPPSRARGVPLTGHAQAGTLKPRSCRDADGTRSPFQVFPHNPFSSFPPKQQHTLALHCIPIPKKINTLHLAQSRTFTPYSVSATRPHAPLWPRLKDKRAPFHHRKPAQKYMLYETPFTLLNQHTRTYHRKQDTPHKHAPSPTSRAHSLQPAHKCRQAHSPSPAHASSLHWALKTIGHDSVTLGKQPFAAWAVKVQQATNQQTSTHPGRKKKSK